MKRLNWLAAAGMAVLVGCGGPAPSPTPAPVEASPPPGPSSIPVTPIPVPIALPMPDRCDVTNGYQLILGDDPFYLMYPGYQPQPSPDGRFILYNQGNKTYLKESSASDGVEISDSTVFFPYDVAWSADGTHLAFARKIDFYANQRDYDIVLADLTNGISGMTTITLPGVMGVSPHVRGWSADGQRLAVLADGTLTEPSRLWMWSAQGDPLYTSHSDPYPLVQLHETKWSPDSQWLAYVWSTFDGSDTVYQLTAVSADGQHETSLEIYRTASPIFDLTAVWSGDSQRVAVVMAGLPIQVIDPQAGQITASYSIPLPMVDPHTDLSTYVPYTPRVSFDVDNRSLLAWSSPDSQTFQLGRWSEQFPDGEQLLGLDHEPKFPRGGQVQRVGIYQGTAGRYQIDLVNADGGEAMPLIENAVDAGDPDWSPTGQTVAAVWTRESGSGRRVSLSWADPYGKNTHQIDTDYVDIQNLNWSPDGSALTFIGVSLPDYTFSVEMVDAASGERHRLISGLTNVIYPRYEDQGTFYTLRWRSVSGQEGFDGYNQDGTRAFHVIVNGDVARASELFFSPDRGLAAIKMRPGQTEELQIADTDGAAPVVVRSSLSGLGDPLWSPDSAFVAFTQSINRGPVTLAIVGRDGEEAWVPPAPPDGYFYPVGAYGPSLKWIPCGS